MSLCSGFDGPPAAQSSPVASGWSSSKIPHDTAASVTQRRLGAKSLQGAVLQDLSVSEVKNWS